MTSFQVIYLFAFAGFLLFAIFQSIKLKVITIKLFVSLLILGLGFLFTKLWYIGLIIIITDIVIVIKQSTTVDVDFEQLQTKNRSIHEEYRRNLEEQKKAYFFKNNIPYNIPNVTYLGGHPGMDNASIYAKSLYLWLYNQALNFIHVKETEVNKYELPLKDIISFDIVGEVYNQINVESSGGEGGGSSIGRAIVGGLLAGEVGAIIGSRKETKPIKIKTTNSLKDNRKTIIYFNYDNNIKSLFLDSRAYDTLIKLIPEKDIKLVNTRNSEKVTILEQIKKLAELRDNGILTEEEYVDKKTKLLEKI